MSEVALAILDSMSARSRAHLEHSKKRHGFTSDAFQKVLKDVQGRLDEIDHVKRTINALVDKCESLDVLHEEQLGEARQQGYDRGFAECERKYFGDRRSLNQHEREIARIKSIEDAREKWPELY